MWDEAVQFIPVVWQLEQRTDIQEDTFFVMLLQKDLKWT